MPDVILDFADEETVLGFLGEVENQIPPDSVGFIDRMLWSIHDAVESGQTSLQISGVGFHFVNAVNQKRMLAEGFPATRLDHFIELIYKGVEKGGVYLVLSS